MSQIHILDQQNDRILDVITEKHILEDVHKQSLKDTLETYNFTTFTNKQFSQFLEKRNRLIIPGEDGEYREFIIEETIKNLNHQAEVYAKASYLEIKKQAIIYPQAFTGQTASQMIGHATNNTEWRPGIVEIDKYRTFEVDSHRNPFAFLKTIAKEIDAELRFRVETDGNRIIGRFVDLLERRGRWRGREATFGKDLASIKRTEKTDNIFTALVGIGPEREDGSHLEVLVEDQDALERWGRRDENDELQHLIGTYEPQSTSQDMTESELKQYTQTELNKRINAVIEFEADIVDLEHVPGLENKRFRFGDTIKMKYTGFEPPLYLEARIFEQERSIVDRSAKKVKLGDFTEFTEEEAQNVWKELQQQINQKIPESRLEEYAYSKPETDNITKDANRLQTGSINANTVPLKTASNGSQLAGGEGVLSKFVTQMPQYQHVGAQHVGAKPIANASFSIPDNFTIVSAELAISALPVRYQYSEQVSWTNVDQANILLFEFGQGYYDYAEESDAGLGFVTMETEWDTNDLFGINRWTPPRPSSNNPEIEMISADIKDIVEAGKDYHIKIESTGSNAPDENTGFLRTVVTIIGYQQ
ncbi:phage tail spike protein [Alkalibacillus salilacus]|uniref:Phage minor structural protein n=1 Tax=Alkalibacillus salilacus TaxID=284582 RepID=A0ABT9VDP2_9BACI|nr:phage tail spike protein [Alkalibacillus salilacus]MDQ0158955.1 phage minor structural protein [Alkalibacillus salilacus]